MSDPQNDAMLTWLDNNPKPQGPNWDRYRDELRRLPDPSDAQIDAAEARSPYPPRD